MRGFFKDRGIDINQYIIPLTRAEHRLRPNGLHTNGRGNWNKQWERWIAKNEDATKEEIFDKLQEMMEKFGLDPDRFPDLELPSCSRSTN